MPNPVLSLLLTSWQLHYETRLVINGLRQKPNQPLRYTLDVAFLKYHTLWPTWLSVPMPAKRVDEVRVQFRLVNSYDPDAQMKARRTFDPGHSDIVCMFYHLMVVIASKYAAPYGQPFTVGRLIFDVLPAEESDVLPPRRRCCSTYSRGGKMVEYLGPTLRRPEQEWDGVDPDTRVKAAELCLRFIKREMTSLLALSRSTFEDGKWVYENIGEIEYRLAGELDAKVNLATKLDTTVHHWVPVPAAYGEDKCRSRYLAWLETVKARRQEARLPVIVAEPVIEIESAVPRNKGLVSPSPLDSTRF